MIRSLLVIAALTFGPADIVMAAPLPAGDYMEDGVLARLTATRSPNDAISAEIETGVPQTIQLSRNSERLVFTANWNWHDSAGLFTRQADGALTQGDGWVEHGFEPPAGMVQDGPAHFRIAYKEIEHGYSFVGDAERTITDNTIVGRYADEAGRPYVFGADGFVHGKLLEGRFALDNDHVFDRYDFFLFGESDRVVIGFRWQDGALQLFANLSFTDDPPSWGEPDFSHPIVTLHPLPE